MFPATAASAGPLVADWQASWAGAETERERLERAEDALRRQKDLLRNIIANIPCAVFWKDCDGVYLGCNQVQVKSELILANPLKWLDLIEKHQVTHTWSPNFGFKLVADRLAELLNRPVTFVDECIGDGVQRAVDEARRAGGGVVLLENLRFNPGETANDPGFASDLASLADVYVDDAFGAVHRAHASVAAGARLRNAVVRDSIINENAVVEDILIEGSVIGENAVVRGAFKQLNVGDSSEVKII